MNKLSFRMAAKTDVGLVRTNNEDNFQACADVASGKMSWVNNQIYTLGDKGALLVVADGMGGMNAGEVASEVAIATIRDYFRPERITPKVTESRFTIERFMNDAIVEADARIKRHAKEHPESRGMGTTMVIAWILDGKLYVSWCGDSRAYIYNPAAGLHQITKDHSYVQSLVDAGKLTREDAFDFPESNIITRSLCDGQVKAKPESLMQPYTLCNGDVVLLCTDGLCGMIRDNEIEAVIRNTPDNDLDLLADNLIKAACDAAGADNVTIDLCRIISGGQECDPSVYDESEKRLNGPLKGAPVNAPASDPEERTANRPIDKRIIYGGAALLALIAVAVATFFITRSLYGHSDTGEEVADTTSTTTAEDILNGVEETFSANDAPSTPTPQQQGVGNQRITTPVTTDPNSEATPGATGNNRTVEDVVGQFTKPGKTQESQDTASTGASSDGSKIDTQQSSTEQSTTQQISSALTPATQPYTVKKGDSLSTIATAHGMSVQQLKELNELQSDEIAEGQTIKVWKQNK